MTPEARSAELQAENAALRERAERDVRGIKMQQKVSGYSRSNPATAAFAQLRGKLSTLCNWGRALLPALRMNFTGQSFYPEIA